MKVELTKKDLVCLVKGTSPNYDVMNNETIKKCGRYVGGFHDKWDWEYGFGDDLTDQQLWDMYILCRNSWNR